MFDTASLPDSYVSLETLKRLGMEDEMIGSKKTHQMAEEGSGFASLGVIELDLRLPNGDVFSSE